MGSEMSPIMDNRRLVIDIEGFHVSAVQVGVYRSLKSEVTYFEDMEVNSVVCGRSLSQLALTQDV